MSDCEGLVGEVHHTTYIIKCIIYKNLRDFTWRVSDCEELVGVNQTSNNHPLNSLKPLSKRILLNEFESSEGQNKILLFGKIV